MVAKNPELTSSEYAAWRDSLTRKIKERSAKPTSQLRREYAEHEIAVHKLAISQNNAEGRRIKKSYQGDPVRYFLSYYLAHPKLGISTLEDYYKYHEGEDHNRDHNMITSVDEKRVEKVSRDEFRKQTNERRSGDHSRLLDISSRKLHFKPHIDLRGKRADEALQEIAHFIDEAIICDVNGVKILHGTGTGVLRQLIRDYLRKNKVKHSFFDIWVE